MAIDVETEVAIARPRDEAAAYASEPDHRKDLGQLKRILEQGS
jgi:hypothetical protein